ncbi:MAG: DUF2710 family protein [Mycobacterium sp.]
MTVPMGESWVSDKERVEAVLRDLAEAADRWEAILAEAQTVTYTVDMGDVHAVANADGKLVGLTLHPGATTEYSHTELTGRLNLAFGALRDEVEEDFQTRYGGELR